MVVGNSMTAAAVANRLGDEVARHAREIEGDAGARRHLHPGGGADRPLQPALGDDLQNSIFTKTTGLVFWGTMVGMLLAADPTDAFFRLQLILLYTLLGNVALAGPRRGHAGLPQLLHPGAPAPRAAACGAPPDARAVGLHPPLAEAARVLDVGCGDGTLHPSPLPWWPMASPASTRRLLGRRGYTCATRSRSFGQRPRSTRGCCPIAAPSSRPDSRPGPAGRFGQAARSSPSSSSSSTSTTTPTAGELRGRGAPGQRARPERGHPRPG